MTDDPDDWPAPTSPAEDARTREALAALNLTTAIRADALRDALVQCGSDRTRIINLLADKRTQRVLDKMAEMDPELARAITTEIDEALKSAGRPDDAADWPNP